MAAESWCALKTVDLDQESLQDVLAQCVLTASGTISQELLQRTPLELQIARVPRPLASRARRTSESRGLFDAVSQKNLAVVEELVSEAAAKLDQQRDGRRPLHEAVRACGAQGDVGYQMLEVLLKHGATSDPLPGDAEGPLHAALKRGCWAAVKLLLASGADPNAIDQSGCSPLHALCRRMPFQSHLDGFQDMLKALLCEANPSVLDGTGRSPAFYTPDAALRKALARADKIYSQRTLRLSCGRCEWLLPEIEQMIVGCA